MERISLFMEEAGEPVSQTYLYKHVRGNKTYKLTAVKKLVELGFIQHVGGGNSAGLALVKAYREGDERLADSFPDEQGGFDFDEL
jgi:hypothetical protein